MKHLLSLLLLMLGASAHANSCAEMEAGYKAMLPHADELVVSRGEFHPPLQVLGRLESLACAIVSFHIDGSGEPYDVRVASSYPAQGIGRAAMEALKSYKFVPVDDGRRRFFLMLKYNRFELR